MITGIILAGGQSSRMGRNKALLPYKKARLIDHVADGFREAGLDSIYVSGEIEGFACIPDRLLQIGPVGGIDATLQYFGPSQSAYLFVPVDMPALPSRFLKSLIEASQGGKSVYFADYFLPALIQDTPTLRTYLQAQLQREVIDCSIQALLKAIQAEALSVKQIDQPYFANMNTPAAWQAFLTKDCE